MENFAANATTFSVFHILGDFCHQNCCCLYPEVTFHSQGKFIFIMQNSAFGTLPQLLNHALIYLSVNGPPHVTNPIIYKATWRALILFDTLFIENSVPALLISGISSSILCSEEFSKVSLSLPKSCHNFFSSFSLNYHDLIETQN